MRTNTERDEADEADANHGREDRSHIGVSHDLTVTWLQTGVNLAIKFPKLDDSRPQNNTCIRITMLHVH